MIGPLAALAVLALQSGSVSISIEETSETLYSDIEGRSEQDIADWFAARQFGGTIGESSTSLSTYYQLQPSDGLCRLTGITAYLHISDTRPRWLDEADGARRVRRQWQTYLTNLQTHLDGHAEIARRGAAIVVDRLSQTAPQENCASLQTTLDALSRNLWDRLDVSQREYDSATQRGRTQGAYIEFRSRR